MKILVAAATNLEGDALKETLSKADLSHTFDFLTTDVGMMAAAFHLTQHLMQHKYDLVMQVGIAGTFRSDWYIGDVVEVVADTYGDTGTEDKDTFIPIAAMNLLQQDKALFDNALFLWNGQVYTGLPKAKAVTVNTCTGSTATQQQRHAMFGADIESMEGLPLHYVCTQLGQPYVQLRGISNYVGERNIAAWNIPLALENLNTFVLRFVQEASFAHQPENNE